jgi:Icc-related predicted phosphoesterase
MVLRIAAVGDVHLSERGAGRYRPQLAALPEQADVLLLAGDLTRHGSAAEARVVAGEFARVGVPVIAVLGNHDHHGEVPGEIKDILAAQGIRVLDGDAEVLTVAGMRVGVAGVKGFGGGFPGASATAYGEPQMKAFVAHTEDEASRLRAALIGLDTEVRIALTHFAPVPETLAGEPVALYPFLGSHQLAGAIDSGGVDLAVHGHAHYGSEHGTTPGGVPVRNVAQPVIDAPFRVIEVAPTRSTVD